MGLQYLWTKCSVQSVLSVSLVIGLFLASNGCLGREITVVNNFTIGGMISNMEDVETDLQLLCVVGFSEEIYLLPPREIQGGKSHIWTIDPVDEKRSASMVCALMNSVEKLESFSFSIDAESTSAESKEDWLVNEDGLRKSGATLLSARWVTNPVNEQTILVNRVPPAVLTALIRITVSNIMQGNDPNFTRVVMQCVAKAKDAKRSLGAVYILAWQTHIWRMIQINNVPDTIFCTFIWTDNFHQRYIMDSNIFDSRTRTSSHGRGQQVLSRQYFLTKAGLALGTDEVYVAEWTPTSR